MNILGIKHSGQLGDVIYSLSFIKNYIKKNNLDKVVIFIPSDTAINSSGPIKHTGGNLMIDEKMHQFIKPLLMTQPYIHEVLYIPKEKIPTNVLDLDVIRTGLVNTAAGNIKSYYYKIFGLIDTDNTGWIEPDSIKKSDRTESFDIIIGRSTRYLNQGIDYTILQSLNKRIGYIGTENEYKKFSNQFPDLSIQNIKINNALEAAIAIQASSIYIGNQSLFFALAEALNHPRLLESFEPVPNVIPCPGNSGCFIRSSAMYSMAADLLRIKVENNHNFDSASEFLLSAH